MQISIEIDPKIVESLSLPQRVCLVLSATIAGVVLLAWFVPALAAALPSPWSLMKANTAFITLAASVALAFSHPRHLPATRTLSRCLAALVGLIALLVLAEYLLHLSLPLELILPYDHASSLPGRMAHITAFDFVLLATVTLLLDQRRRFPALLGDSAVGLLAISLLINSAGWIFGATRLFGLDTHHQVAPTTLICLLLLTFVAISRRAECGFFAIMLGLGPGSRIARIAFPLALLLPFALEALRAAAIRGSRISPEYASAFATTFAVMLAFVLVLALARRMYRLEGEILDCSLRDDLTGLYNRRGFFLMAEQSLWQARRSSIPFFVLYVDLDGLKRINDANGHGMGSAFIREAGELIKQVVRKIDIVGRIGGDEFVVAGQSDDAHMRVIVERLRAVAEEHDLFPDRLYPFSLSLGHASSNGRESLEQLLQRADAAMYESKKRRNGQRQ